MPSPLLDETPAFSSDFDHCRSVIRAGSKSFFAASTLLPQDVRTAAFAIYAFCRRADDMIDLEEGPAGALVTLRHRLDRAYAGTPESHPVDRAFASVVAEYRVPKALPLALLEGLAWDVEGRRYTSLEALHDYSARVAGAVGAMMTTVMGATSERAVARACDLGVAMQLTNIARDIGEDARAGRLYMPLGWMADVGLEPEAFLSRPVFDARLAQITARLLETAEPLYKRGLSGVSLLPRGCQTAIKAASLIYREIGQEIRDNGFDSVSKRAVVPRRRKLTLLAKAATLHPPIAHDGPALAETQFLVDAVAKRPKLAAPPRQLGRRAYWVLDLFDRLERRKRAGRRPLKA